MYKFDVAERSFEEDEALQISLSDKDDLSYPVFDQTFENIFYLKNYEVVEQRSIDDLKKVKMSIRLEAKVVSTAMKQLALSNDGRFCAIGSGFKKPSFYLIDLKNKQQFKLTTKVIINSYAPCFINGDTQYLAIGGYKGVEVWDINSRKSLTILEFPSSGWCSASSSNILAFGSETGLLRLWDVGNWEVVHEQTFIGLQAYSLDLTADLKHLTIAGNGGDKCIVMEIK